MLGKIAKFLGTILLLSLISAYVPFGSIAVAAFFFYAIWHAVND